MDTRYLPCNKINTTIYSDFNSPRYLTKHDHTITIMKDLTDKNIFYKNIVSILLDIINKDEYRLNTRIKKPNIIINKQNTDTNNTTDKFTVLDNKYNFLQDISTDDHIKSYIWKLERNLGITKQIDIDKEIYGHFGNSSITPLEDYIYLKKTKLSNINNYLFYNY